MNPALSRDQARYQITERVARAREPRMPHVARRQRLASGLRRVADGLDR